MKCANNSRIISLATTPASTPDSCAWLLLDEDGHLSVPEQNPGEDSCAFEYHGHVMYSVVSLQQSPLMSLAYCLKAHD